MNNQEIGHLYKFQGGLLGDRFLGGAIVMAQQILQGGYTNPTQAQQAWAAAAAAATDVTGLANAALKWGIVNNTTLQNSGNAIDDSGINYIIAEAAKEYSAA